jgi:hypothetical protein
MLLITAFVCRVFFYIFMLREERVNDEAKNRERTSHYNALSFCIPCTLVDEVRHFVIAE